MQQFLQLFLWLPLAGFALCMLAMPKKESFISGIAIFVSAIHLILGVFFVVAWMVNGGGFLDVKHLVLYKSPEFEFFIGFLFDQTTAVFQLTGSLIMLLVSVFSKYYMHRDRGFKRYFSVLLLFFLGYNLIIFGSNLETLFTGWEILGICSFLLIAFYRDRYLPVKNAMKVISVYRLGDVCLMLAMWMCHHIFHQNITFKQMGDSEFITSQSSIQASFFIFTALMLLVAAAVKSAALPFSSWLPRAMEGPTSSSAVFYGSLSVHLGAYLLIRTYPLWQHIILIKVLVIALGIVTALVAAFIARVQPTVKTQIAYSSITQIGLIFAEIGLGLHVLALVHFSGNALLRTYQLLVSPSVLSYQVHDMFFNFRPAASIQPRLSFNKLRHAIFILNIKEWNLDGLMYRFLWTPFKLAGRNMSFLVKRIPAVLLSALFLFGMFSFAAAKKMPVHQSSLLPLFFSVLGLLLVLTSFTERGSAIRGWFCVLAGQCFVTLSIALNEHVATHQLVIYLSGVLASALVGYICLLRAKSIDGDISLNKYHGYAYDKPVLAFVYLVSSLGTIGFPITPTFLGIDLLFTHVHKDQVLLITSTALSFIFIEISILRIFSRIFMGPSKKQDHPIAFRSS